MRFLEIPAESLSRTALHGLIEEFVTREGTDYGDEEHTLEEKRLAVEEQLESGELVITFDLVTQTSNIIER